MTEGLCQFYLTPAEARTHPKGTLPEHDTQALVRYGTRTRVHRYRESFPSAWAGAVTVLQPSHDLA
ncbi:hypothetical protein C7212DRAFT_304056 [Tuber magnatum]|uniref:Uncharacterized protein n=1 Tax=Tuber magnatum TaxID=42249 RepID=A0A317SXW0_9PEZI|nr:hypothetical protein C7212DRAFT_304055 [Tuber magnatum]PWW79203.1 hypothetical protein C7212DRAFT_304056 [Tuber magnatum]